MPNGLTQPNPVIAIVGKATRMKHGRDHRTMDEFVARRKEFMRAMKSIRRATRAAEASANPATKPNQIPVGPNPSLKAQR